MRQRFLQGHRSAARCPLRAWPSKVRQYATLVQPGRKKQGFLPQRRAEHDLRRSGVWGGSPHVQECLATPHEAEATRRSRVDWSADCGVDWPCGVHGSMQAAHRKAPLGEMATALALLSASDGARGGCKGDQREPFLSRKYLRAQPENLPQGGRRVGDSFQSWHARTVASGIPGRRAVAQDVPATDEGRPTPRQPRQRCASA